ncbi:hypothetical protein [Streptomyces sp. WZ-12]|uniref:hypothetical protein n=1 Tax=Streptomyces sp. WZ-12 TaxID=3030210 RepID=UPI002380DD4C|nr:hypothetical protein [Streptomyces sp. WZ-12]
MESEEDAARAELTGLQERLIALEERLTALSITRRTLTELLPAPPVDETSSAEEPPGSERGRPSTEQPSYPNRAQQTTSRKAQGGLKGPEDQKIVTLIASADRPLRAREVTIALGQEPSRSQVEVIRRACLKLARAGRLRVLSTGELTGPEGAA